MIKLTLDTNCIVNLLDYKSESATSVDELSEIIRYAMDGNANITITTRVQADLSKDKLDERKEEMLKKISMFPVIGTVARWDISTWDSGDTYSDEKTDSLIEEIKNTLFPSIKKLDKHYSNKINDVDHLVGHLKNKRDIFVTDDTDILKKKETLNDSFGIKVASPQEVVEILNSQTDKNVLANEYYEKLKDYRDWLISVAESEQITDSDEDLYEKHREWLMKKTPKIIDSLANIDFRQNSVLVGTQRVFDQMQLIGMQNRQKNLQKLFNKSDLAEQMAYLHQDDSAGVYYRRVNNDSKKAIKEKFKNHLDNLLSLIGYTDSE